jgi:hypothetical protein
VRLALQDLKWQEVGPNEAWDLYWSDMSVSGDRVCRVAASQVWSYLRPSFRSPVGNGHLLMTVLAPREKAHVHRGNSYATFMHFIALIFAQTHPCDKWMLYKYLHKCRAGLHKGCIALHAIAW